MLFNSWAFLLFLAALFAIYYSGLPGLRAGGGQVTLLIAGSFFFYGHYLPVLVLLLAGSLLVNGFVSQRLMSLPPDSPRRRAWLLLGLGVNLGALGFFKYAALLSATLLPAGVARELAPTLQAIPLPVGISFYTFQGISLVIDAYWNRQRGLETLNADLAAGRTFAFHRKVWFFVSFFPQLVAGPIIEAHNFVNQIGRKHFRDIDWDDAGRKLVTGFFLKMVVADNLKEATANLVYPQFLSLSAPDLVTVLFAFSFQIFADFAGYSLIAMGLGRLFGYHFPLNFNFPYLSQSITEFWRRWHISLSAWLRDYLYIPLGGNRRGAGRTYVNLFIVMFLGGLWHGAAWSYAIWGMAHGLFLALERFAGPRLPAVARWPRLLRPAVALTRIGLVFVIVSLLWLLFKLPEFNHVLAYFSAIAHGRMRLSAQLNFVIILFSLPAVLYHLWGATLAWRRNHARVTALGEHLILGAMLFLIVVNSGTPGAFIYFQF